MFTRVLLFAVFLTPIVFAQSPVKFPTQDGGLISADLYGTGNRGVVLAHGGQFNKESWKPQAQQLADAGFRVLAFDFRGYGQSRGPGQADLMSAPLYLDVLAAVRFLRGQGAKTVSVVGASMGGYSGADAVIKAKPGEIDRLVELGAAAGGFPPENIKCRKLIIVARGDTSGDGPRLPHIQEAYDKMPEPKQLIVLDGSAHAQFLFQTPQGAQVMGAILTFLSAP